MQKAQLAQALRQRQHQRGLRPAHVIDALTDDAIIDSYITCVCCGVKQVTPQQLKVAIAQAQDVEHFFTLCDDMSIRPG